MTPITLPDDLVEQDAIPCFDLINSNPTDHIFYYKNDWLKARANDGMVIKKLDTPEDAYIEYMPAEKSWKPVYAPNYTLIHHIYVPDDFEDQRLKTALIHTCESENSDKNGIAIILENQDFIKQQHYYVGLGYLEYAHLPGFTLLVKKFKPDAPTPLFVLSLNEKTKPKITHGITITYANQSIFISYYIHEMKNAFREMGFNVKLRKLDSAQEAWESGSPYGTFGVFLDGHFLTHKLLTPAEIENLVGTLELDNLYPES
ncbi:MAG: YoaP domain-containing protein [Balneolaceae bacterium]